jgi:hypothetical protein
VPTRCAIGGALAIRTRQPNAKTWQTQYLATSSSETRN